MLVCTLFPDTCARYAPSQQRAAVCAQSASSRLIHSFQNIAACLQDERGECADLVCVVDTRSHPSSHCLGALKLAGVERILFQ